MSKFRTEKIQEQIKELSAIFIEKESTGTSFITVTRVETSPDNRYATIFITVMPQEKENAAYGFIKRNLGELRKFITEKFPIHPIPYLDIKIDEGEKHRQKIDELLKNN